MDYIYIAKFLGVMTSMILADVSWTYYFIKIEERRPIGAGIWGSLIIVFGAFTTLNYVGDHTLLIAAILGSFIGTALTVEYKRRKDLKSKEEIKKD